MKIVKFTDTTHNIDLVPRFYPSDVIVLELFNEATRVFTIVNNTYIVTNGILTITFDFTFKDRDRYQMKISENDVIVFRGKIVATDQDPQKFKLTEGKYTYFNG